MSAYKVHYKCQSSLFKLLLLSSFGHTSVNTSVQYKCQSSLFKLLLLSSFGHEQVRDIGPTAHFQLFGDPLDSSHDKSLPQIHCAFGVA
jgi:hypothetical protein